MKHIIITMILLMSGFGIVVMGQEQITTQQFKEKVWDYKSNSQRIVLKSKLPVILDFYATWCRPCKMLSPELEKLQKDYKGKILVYKIDIDQEPELARVFGVSSVPTVYFIKTDGNYDGFLGYRTYDEIKQSVDTFFFKGKK
ncbi:MAG: thioredoxin domain-containing protein [Paludibacteraceae bacterium]|nr:thioredoxin domain-containing protein [Paludibacteraceae bacterium]